MTDIKLPDIKDIDLNKEVSFTYPEGFFEAAAVLDFLPNDATKIQMLTGLCMTTSIL